MILSPTSRIRYESGNTNIVFDGNSLTEGGQGGGTPYPTTTKTLAPVSGAGTIVNLGVGGQTTRKMNGLDGGSAADVDAAFVVGKTNILVAWECTNTIRLGLTGTGADVGIGLRAASDMRDYIQARLAVHPWKVVLVTTIPRYETTSGTIQQMNDELTICDNYLRANYRAMGAHVLADVRAPGSPFNLPDLTAASFTGPGLYYTGDGAGVYVHLTNAGYAIVAQYVASALRRLPAR